jgi:hypothetical protein
MFISKDDGTTLVHIPEEHMQISYETDRWQARIWSRLGAVAVIVGSLIYLFVWN